MDKQRIRKVLAAVTVAGVAAALAMTTAGCKSSCGSTSCSGEKKADTAPKGSCSGGSCTGMKK